MACPPVDSDCRRLGPRRHLLVAAWRGRRRSRSRCTSNWARTVIPLWIILAYLVVLLILGFASNHFSRGTQVDYFLASRGVGSFMLLMSLFGTTMTAFAMVGSSGEASQTGIGVYGLMASSSGIIHSLCFFLVGVKLWSHGK